MRVSIRLSRALIYVLPLVLFSGEASAQQVPSGPRLAVCLSKDGAPTDRCLKPRRLGFRLAPIGGPRDRRPADVDLVFEVGPDEFHLIDVLAERAARGEDVPICIIDGANICPPEPFEIVWICITTGLLAGEECPEMPEDASGPVTTIRMRSPSR